MRDRLQLEAWASEIVQSVGRKQLQEDDRIEFKSEWPSDHYKIARQIAGMANAAGGHEVVLLIGVNPEKPQPFIGTGGTDPSEWLPGVLKQFSEGHCPDHVVFQPRFGEYHCVAIVFDSSNAPFLIKNSSYGTSGHVINAELPWRSGTNTRTARRSEILSLMHRNAGRPHLEILSGGAGRTLEQNGGIWVQFKLYAMTVNGQRLIMPFHRMTWSFDKGSERVTVAESKVYYYPNERDSVQVSSSDISIPYSGSFTVQFFIEVPILELHQIKFLDVEGIFEIGPERLPVKIKKNCYVRDKLDLE
jgi:hypothetical protein